VTIAFALDAVVSAAALRTPARDRATGVRQRAIGSRVAPASVEKQQRHLRYRVPCNPGARVLISRARGALLLSCTQASVAEFRRQMLAPDDLQDRGSISRRQLLRPGGACVGTRETM
jgi:hypothetical protein